MEQLELDFNQHDILIVPTSTTDDVKTKRCPFWDCGWCYREAPVETSNGECLGYEYCDVYARVTRQ